MTKWEFFLVSIEKKVKNYIFEYENEATFIKASDALSISSTAVTFLFYFKHKVRRDSQS